MLTLGRELQEQAGAIGLLDAVERSQALGQLLTGGKGARVALFTEDVISALDQFTRADDVLQGGQAQAGQAQQMLGFGQAPVLAAGAKDSLQALAQALLVTLQLSDQTPTVFQFGCGRQNGQLRRKLLFTLLQGLGLLAQGLQVLCLALLGALELANLPYAPPANCDTCRAQQQGQDCQTIAGPLGSFDGGLCRSLWGLQFIVGQDSFAHVSILCITARRQSA